MGYLLPFNSTTNIVVVVIIIIISRVVSRELVGVSKKTKWCPCLDAVAVTVQRIAEHDLSVAATCHVDAASGLLEFPIHGSIDFTQPVSDSSTAAELHFFKPIFL